MKMETKIDAEIDFDTWSEMARNDPEAFERMRLEAIESVINSAPEETQVRLRRLQWRIDQERRLARTPMAACLRISRMMWRSVLGEGGLQQRFEELQEVFHGRNAAPARVPVEAPPAGEVVAFARARD
jgi:hypothetical protein